MRAFRFESLTLPPEAETSTVPPEASTRVFTMCRPNPTPPAARVFEESSWTNGRKIRLSAV